MNRDIFADCINFKIGPFSRLVLSFLDCFLIRPDYPCPSARFIQPTCILGTVDFRLEPIGSNGGISVLRTEVKPTVSLQYTKLCLKKKIGIFFFGKQDTMPLVRFLAGSQ